MGILRQGWQCGGLAVVWSTLGLPALALCPADLPATLEAIAARPELSAARLGVQVETLAGKTVASREGDRFFVPASTLKLLTTAAVLTELGPAATLPTVILGATNADGTTTLQVMGGGDPSFDQGSLDALTTQLAQQNIRQVDILYGNESAFPGEAVIPIGNGKMCRPGTVRRSMP